MFRVSGASAVLLVALLLVAAAPPAASAQDALQAAREAALNGVLANRVQEALSDAVAFLQSQYELHKGVVFTAIFALLALGAATALFSVLRKVVLLGLVLFAAVVVYNLLR